MRGNSVRMAVLPVILAAGLGACANNGVQPGYVNTSYGSSTSTAANYGGAQTGDTGRVVSINDVSMRGGSGGGSGNGPMVGGLLGGRGIEVTVQRDDGRTVTVAQRDDGDVQLGDRVQVIQDRGGVAKVVRDNSRQPDYQNNPSPQNYAPAPQDYRQSGGSSGGGYGNYGPPPQDYRQSGSYGSSP